MNPKELLEIIKKQRNYFRVDHPLGDYSQDNLTYWGGTSSYYRGSEYITFTIYPAHIDVHLVSKWDHKVIRTFFIKPSEHPEIYNLITDIVIEKRTKKMTSKNLYGFPLNLVAKGITKLYKCPFLFFKVTDWDHVWDIDKTAPIYHYAFRPSIKRGLSPIKDYFLRKTYTYARRKHLDKSPVVYIAKHCYSEIRLKAWNFLDSIKGPKGDMGCAGPAGLKGKDGDKWEFMALSDLPYPSPPNRIYLDPKTGYVYRYDYESDLYIVVCRFAISRGKRKA